MFFIDRANEKILKVKNEKDGIISSNLVELNKLKIAVKALESALETKTSENLELVKITDDLLAKLRQK